MQRLILLYLLIFSVFSMQAQSITGKIIDESNKAVPYATVILKKATDSTLVKGEITNETGAFIFSDIKNGQYFIQVQYVGYKPAFIENINFTGSEIYLDPISLQNNAAALKEVTVVGEKPFIEKMADKTVVNIENSIIQVNSSILEVMEKLPGVLVDQDGNISLRGKQNVTIMIDGKPASLSGQDLANLLRGMPSANIQKIELITNPSAKFDASGNAGIINIIMKKNRMEGYNGNVSLGYGQGRYPKYNGSVNFNYKKDWFNLYTSYSYSNKLFFNHLMINRKFYDEGVLTTTFDNDNYIVLPFNTHSPRIGMDFYLSEKTTLSVLGSSVITNFNPTADNKSTITNGSGEIIGNYKFTNESDDANYNAEINTQLTHKLDTTGQNITINLDYGRYWNRSNQLFNTIFSDASSNQNVTTSLYNKQLGDLSLYSAKADYTKPFGKTFTFEAGVKSSLVESDKDMQFYNGTSEFDKYDSSRSSHFLYSENINAAYINFNKKFNKVTLQAGLRTEHTKATGKQLLNNEGFERDYIQLFPTVYVDYNFNKNHNINFNVGRRIDRPHYEQMNPFRRLIDANTYGEGNPYLKPQINYIAEVSYAYKNALHLAVNYSYSTDNITSILIQDPITQTTVQTVVNLDETNYYSVNLSYVNKLTKWWRTNTGILAFYSNYNGMVKNYNIDQGTPSFNFNTNNSFIINDGFSVEANFRYSHKNLYGVTTMRSTSNFSLGMQKSILKDKGSLSINMTDIFWNAYPAGVTEFDSVVEHWESERETRVFNINFNYKFGKGKTGRMRRNTGADEEKRRI